jgi:hypothetical protein
MTNTACPFCGGPADSKEHAWPQWVSRHFAGRPLTLYDRSRLGVPPRTVKVLNAEVRIGSTCCNSAWLSKLEAEARDLLAATFDGKPQPQLDQDEQGLLALWATKTLMMLDLWQGGPKAFEPRHFREVHAQRTPPTDAVVVLAAMQLPRPHRRGRPEPPQEHAVYSQAGAPERHRLTFNVGAFAAQLRLGAVTPGEARTHTRPWAVQVWPPEAAFVDWPPPERLDVVSLSHFATPGSAYDERVT